MKHAEFLALCERAHTGAACKKSDFDMEQVVEPVMDLVEEYDLDWDRQNLIPTDEQTLRNIFDAAVRLLEQSGIFNITTNRIMRLSREEIEEGIANMKQSLVMGEGKDAVALHVRKIEDTVPPVIWAGNPGCPTPERFFYENVLASAKEPVVDLLTCGSLADVEGFAVTPGSPSEVLAVRRELQTVRRVLDMVGRPGMGLLTAQSAVTEVGDYAAVGENRMRGCDAHLIAIFNELAMDNGNLVRAANALDGGVRNASLACTMVGGLGGDAPGAAVVMVASMLAANLFGIADYHLCHPIHIRNVATTERSCLWVQAVVCQIFSTIAPGIVVCDIWPASGAMTKELLYETAANAILVTVAGGHLEGVGAANGNRPNGTGLEVRLMGEVGKAVAAQGMKRAEANAIVLRLLERYEHIFAEKDGNPGVAFDEAYDLATVEPVHEWQKMYDEVRRELIELGVKF